MARLIEPDSQLGRELAHRASIGRLLIANAALPPLPHTHELRLHTHPDVQIDVVKDKLGVESGHLWNTWIDCVFMIIPSAKGVRWTATFTTLDDGKVHTVIGAAPSRQMAAQLVLHGLTARIALEVETRRAWMKRWNHAQQLSLRDGVPLASPPRPLRVDCPACGHDISDGPCRDADCDCATCQVVNEAFTGSP